MKNFNKYERSTMTSTIAKCIKYEKLGCSYSYCYRISLRYKDSYPSSPAKVIPKTCFPARFISHDHVTSHVIHKIDCDLQCSII